MNDARESASADVSAPGGEPETVAALRHRFRNQIQMMTSVASLFGQRLPAGEGRDAFQDMRARFEQVSVLNGEDALSAPPERILAALAERLHQLYDPDRRRTVAITAQPIEANERRLATLAQLLTEMMIDLFRTSDPAGAAQVALIATPDGGARIVLSAEGAAAENRAATPALGLAILDSLARGLGGELNRSVEPSYRAEVVIPPDAFHR